MSPKRQKDTLQIENGRSPSPQEGSVDLLRKVVGARLKIQERCVAEELVTFVTTEGKSNPRPNHVVSEPRRAPEERLRCAVRPGDLYGVPSA